MKVPKTGAERVRAYRRNLMFTRQGTNYERKKAERKKSVHSPSEVATQKMLNRGRVR